MTNTTKRSFFIALACGVLPSPPPVQAAKVKTEDELIADLASPKEEVVTSAMLLKVGKAVSHQHQGTGRDQKISRRQAPAVHRKAARVLGALHAEVTSAEIKSICALLRRAIIARSWMVSSRCAV